VADGLDRHAPGAVLVVATNLVDLLTYELQAMSSRPHACIIGTGTLLDTARLRAGLGARYGVSPRSVHAYVLASTGTPRFRSGAARRSAECRSGAAPSAAYRSTLPRCRVSSRMCATRHAESSSERGKRTWPLDWSSRTSSRPSWATRRRCCRSASVSTDSTGFVTCCGGEELVWQRFEADRAWSWRGEGSGSCRSIRR
jgi:hypothetical protein